MLTTNAAALFYFAWIGLWMLVLKNPKSPSREE